MNNPDMTPYIIATYATATIVFAALWGVSYYKMKISQKKLDKLKNRKQNES